VLPGRADTPLYLATGDYVADAAFDVLCVDGAPRFLHLTHDRSRALRLGELVDLAFERFCRDPRFAARRVLRPLYADLDSFRLLENAVTGMAGPTVTQALSTVAPFAAQLFIDKDIRVEHAPTLSGACLPDPAVTLERICAALPASRWGRGASA
jgi:hypothetical protein